MTGTTKVLSFLLLLSPAMFCQAASLPAFEVATVRPAAPREGGGHFSNNGTTVSSEYTTLSSILARAFGLTSLSQLAGPEWVFQNRYDILAKVPDGAPKDEIPGMLQRLLIERFKLTLHHEMRNLPSYALVRGPGKLKLVRVDSEAKNSAVVTGTHREMKSMSMEVLAQMISLTLRVPVVNQTGLEGYFDFPFDPTVEETGRDTLPSVFTSVGELGLKLNSQRVPTDVIVIDLGDKVPVEN